MADEAQRCKDEGSAVAKSVELVGAGARILLTATPVQNNLSELRALLNLAVVGAAGTREQWRSTVERPIEASKAADASLTVRIAGQLAVTRLHQRLLRCMLLARSNDHPGAYPLPRVYTLLLRMTPLQRSVYEAMVDNFDSSKAFLFSTHLQTLLLHPKLLGKHLTSTLGFLAPRLKAYRWPQDPRQMLMLSSTTRAAVELLEAILDQTNDRVVVVSASVAVLELVAAYVRSRAGGREMLQRLTGEKATDRARDAASAAMEGRGAGRVLLLSLTLAAGLNLQGCNHMILLAPTWNPTEDVQALGRLARPGQQKQSFHYRLGAAGTLSEDIFIRQKDKQGLARAVTSGVLGSLSAVERDLMFAVDADGAPSRLASALSGAPSGGVFGARVLDDAVRPAGFGSAVPECPALEALLGATVAVEPRGEQNDDPNAMLVEEEQRPLVAHVWRAERREWLGNGPVEPPAPAPREGAAEHRLMHRQRGTW